MKITLRGSDQVTCDVIPPFAVSLGLNYYITLNAAIYQNGARGMIIIIHVCHIHNTEFTDFKAIDCSKRVRKVRCGNDDEGYTRCICANPIRTRARCSCTETNYNCDDSTQKR